MKKFIILFLALAISGIAKSQFISSDSNSINPFSHFEGESPAFSFPNNIIREKRAFDSIRNEIHISGVKYRYIEFDSLENPEDEHVFDLDGFGIPRISISRLEEKQFSLVDLEGRIIRMIYLDPKI